VGWVSGLSACWYVRKMTDAHKTVFESNKQMDPPVDDRVVPPDVVGRHHPGQVQDVLGRAKLGRCGLSGRRGGGEGGQIVRCWCWCAFRFPVVWRSHT
jgi:hypothetical protein